MSELLTALAIMFVIAGPFLLLANRLDLPAAPLLIIAGVGAGFFVEPADALELAQFGIALLVFSFGVVIELHNIETVIADSELAAFAQIFVVGSIGTGLGVLLGLPITEAVFLGVAAALSSTMVATALLETEVRMNLVHGRLGQSLQFVQDLFAVAFVLVVAAGVLELDPIVLNIGYGALFVIAAILANQYLFPLIERLAGESVELMIVGVIAMLTLSIAAALAVEVPIVVGAFTAGLAVRHDAGENLGLFNGLESVQDFFVAVFFITVGALVVLPFAEMGVAASIEKLAIVASLVLLTVVVKPAVTIAILIYRGYGARTAVLTGLSTDQISEFSLIIAIEALLIGVLTQSVFDAIILAAAVTMIISTVTHQWSERIFRVLSNTGLVRGRHRKVDQLSDVPEDLSDHVVVIGYGRKGRRLVRALEELDQPYVVIENDPAVHESARVDCEAYVFGDVMEPYTLEKANAEEARVIVSVTSSVAVSRRLLHADFDGDLVLRARDEPTALEFLDAGATYVAVPDLLSGEQLITHLQALVDGGMTPAELRSEGLAELEAESLLPPDSRSSMT